MPPAGEARRHGDVLGQAAGKNGYRFYSALNGPVLRVELGRTNPLSTAST